MKITVPSYTVVRCDRCEAESKQGEGIFKNGGAHGTMHVWSRSAMGDAGGITMDIDLCSDCAIDFEKFLKNKDNKK